LSESEVAWASIACLSISGTAVQVIYPKVRVENGGLRASPPA
jgi:hypothetical protein